MQRRPAAGTRRRAGPAGLAVAGLVLTSCSGSQSALDTGGPAARRIEGLWWGLFAVATVVFLIVVFLLVWALVLRRGPDVTPRRGGERTVLVAGVIVPTVVLVGTFVATLGVMRANSEPPTPTELAIEVVGHDWWWEVRYPDFVTANEIHIPVGRAVHVELRT